jgi:hypothetical protein
MAKPINLDEDGKGGGADLDKNRTPQANFKRLVNKNAIKPKIGDPPGILAINLSYPVPWIFNPCTQFFVFKFKSPVLLSKQWK